jgi:hypothetical protein
LLNKNVSNGKIIRDLVGIRKVTVKTENRIIGSFLYTSVDGVKYTERVNRVNSRSETVLGVFSHGAVDTRFLKLKLVGNFPSGLIDQIDITLSLEAVDIKEEERKLVSLWDPSLVILKHSHTDEVRLENVSHIIGCATVSSGCCHILTPYSNEDNFVYTDGKNIDGSLLLSNGFDSYW